MIALDANLILFLLTLAHCSDLKNIRMRLNESDDFTKNYQSGIKQIINIDDIPSLGDQQNQTNQHYGYQDMPFTKEKTEEEQLKEEFLESSESKNFAVGETVLIDGLKTGPPGEPLPNGKRAQIIKGPMYKRNNRMNGIVQEKYEISFENKNKYLPSEFLHKTVTSGLDNERINWGTKLRQYFAQELYGHKWSHGEIYVLVEKFKLDVYKTYDDAKAKFHEVVKFVTSKKIYGGQMRHRFKLIADNRLAKEFGTLEILSALAKKNCNIDRTLDYLDSTLENRRMKTEDSSKSTQADIGERIDADDYKIKKMGSASTSSHQIDIGEIADGRKNHSNYQKVLENEDFGSTSNILNANAIMNLQEFAIKLDNEIENSQENDQKLLHKK